MIVALIAMPISASAQPDAATHYAGLLAEDRRLIQLLLIWTGDYEGMMDADIGPGTMRAIRAFEGRNQLVADGVLDPRELEVLGREAQEALDRVGFDIVDDPATGVRLGMPLALVEYEGPDEYGGVYSRPDESIAVFTTRLPNQNLAALYESFRTNPERRVEYAAWGGSWFVVSGTDGQDTFYLRFEARGSEVRGFSLYYFTRLAPDLRRVAVAMSNLFDPFPSSTRPQQTPPPAPSPPAAQEPRVVQSGTGFVVAADGTVLTNAHVVEGCSTVTVGDWGDSTRIIRDEANDLAIIVPTSFPSTSDPISFAPRSPRLGDDVLVFGFPLSQFLASSLNVTQGIVSSLAGPGNDSRYLQISAPVNPGNSGGPLLDANGHVVGVVTARLDDVAVLGAVGALPAGVAFAIRRDIVLAFLESNGVEPMVGTVPSSSPSISVVAANVGQSVLPLSCVSTR